MSIPQTPSPLSNILAAKTYNAAWFSGSTKELQITAAIAAAVADGAVAVYVPANMLPYDATAVTFNTSVKMTCEGADPGSYDVQAYGAAADFSADATAAINAACAAACGPSFAGGKVKMRRGLYSISSTIQIPNNVWIIGDGFKMTLVRRAFIGPLFSFTAANNQGLFDLRLDGNGQNATMLNFVDNGFYSQTSRLFITNYTGNAYTFANDAGNSSMHSDIYCEPTGASTTVPAIVLGTDSGPNYRFFTRVIVFNNNPLFDNGSSEMNWFISCGAATMIFSGATSKKTMVQGCRIATSGATTTIRGINHSIVGNEFAGPVTFDSTTNTCTHDSNVDFGTTDLGSNNKIGNIESAPETVTYSASMTPDAAKAATHIITATNGTAFTVNNPINLPITGGKTFELVIRNASGGALGAATFGAIYKHSTWTLPANGFSRTVRYRWDGTNLIEISRTPNDVPN